MKFPKFVWILADAKGYSKCALRLEKIYRGNYVYYRDAGDWEVRFKVVNDKLFVNEPTGQADHLDGLELVECSKQEYLDDNEGYV